MDNASKLLGVHCIIYKILPSIKGDGYLSFLLCKRDYLTGRYPAHWTCLGGKPELDEGLEETLCREIKEECNLSCLPEQFRPLCTIPLYNLGYISYFTYELKSSLSQLRMLKECTGLAFFNSEDLRQIRMKPEDRRALNVFSIQLGS